MGNVFSDLAEKRTVLAAGSDQPTPEMQAVEPGVAESGVQGGNVFSRLAEKQATPGGNVFSRLAARRTGVSEVPSPEDFLKQHVDWRLLREYGLPGPGEQETPPGTLVPPIPRSQFVRPEVTTGEKLAGMVGSLIPTIPEGEPSPVPPQRGITSFAYAKYGAGKPFVTAEGLQREATEPLLPVGQLVRSQIAKLPDEPSRWALNTVLDLGQLSADTVEGLSTPANIGILTALATAPEVGAGLWIKRLTALGFAEEMARASADKLTSGFAKARRGEYRAAGQDFASGVVDASFSVASGLATRRTPGFKPERNPQSSSLLPHALSKRPHYRPKNFQVWSDRPLRPHPWYLSPPQ